MIPSPKMHLDRRAADLADRLSGDDDDLLTTEELADWVGYSRQWFEIARTRGDGPQFCKIGSRGRVRYRRGDVRTWLRERQHRSTAEYRDAAKRQGRLPGSRVMDGRVVPPQEGRTAPAGRPLPLRRNSRAPASAQGHRDTQTGEG